MSNVRTVDFLTGLSSVFRLSIHHGVLVMYVIVIENNGRANCPRTSGNRHNSAEFGGTRQCGKPAKRHRMSFQLTNQCSVTYVRFASHAHGVYTIAPHLNMWNTPIVRKDFVNNNYEFRFIR